MRSDTFAATRLRFAVDVRTRRRLLGLSQVGLALRLNVAFSTISRIEKGDRLPSYDTIVALARALDTTPRALCRPPGAPFLVGGYERKLVDFARSRGLSRRQVDRLIAVGRVMFHTSADKE